MQATRNCDLQRRKASTICGSDIRCIYHEHLGKGPEGYQGVIAGHEPCGEIVEIGPHCKEFDVGDFIGAEGVLFRTRTDELSVRVEKLTLLAKALQPLPDKWHGLTDTELRYRRRYVDLVMNETSREV